MSTPPSNNTARDMVLATAELLEMILLELDPIDARVATRVSRIVKAGFEASKKIQSRYMYTPNNAAKETLVNEILFEPYQGYKTYRTYRHALPYIIARPNIEEKKMKLIPCNDRPHTASDEVGDFSRMHLTSSSVDVTIIIESRQALQSNDWFRAQVELRNPRMGEVLDAILRLSDLADKTAALRRNQRETIALALWKEVFGQELAAMVVGGPAVESRWP